MPPQARPHALADLEARIAAAEVLEHKSAYVVALLTAAGRPVRREEAMVLLAAQKLAQLRESRSVLASGESGDRQN